MFTSNLHLNLVGQRIGINALMNSHTTKGRKATADAIKALIGAVYVDGGLNKAKEVVHRLGLVWKEEVSSPAQHVESIASNPAEVLPSTAANDVFVDDHPQHPAKPKGAALGKLKKIEHIKKKQIKKQKKKEKTEKRKREKMEKKQKKEEKKKKGEKRKKNRAEKNARWKNED